MTGDEGTTVSDGTEGAGDETVVNGRYPLAARINSFRGKDGSVADAIRAAARVPGITALELNYPQHIVDLGKGELARLLAETGLPLTALNLRFDATEFEDGAFTNPELMQRERAIRVAQTAIELAAEHGARHVVLWMERDGQSTPFEADLGGLWESEVDGLRRVAAHDLATRVSVEYKPAEPGRSAVVPVIGTMGEALLAVTEAGLSNLGVTIDVCHALMAREAPAAAATLALRAGRLFGVHLNDGYGAVDDGLAVGSVDPLRTLELLHVLRRYGYDGTIYFDTFPPLAEAAADCLDDVATVRRCEEVLERADSVLIERAFKRRNGDAARELLRRSGFVAPVAEDRA